MDFHHALRDAPVAIERLRGDAEVNGLVRRQPLIRREKRLQRSVADIHRARRRARLARRIRHVRGDAVSENRLVLFRNRRIGLRRELDIEAAVIARHRRSVRDFLRVEIRHWAPPETAAPPIRQPHIARHAPAHLRSVDGRARVSCRLARHAHLLAELRGRLRRFERDLEFRAFVFLDVERRLPARLGAGANHHPSHQAVARRGEAAAKRSIVVRLVLGLRDFLSVHVGENDRHRLPAENVVFIRVAVGSDADAFVLNRLPRAVERAVGEEDGLRSNVGTLVLAVGVQRIVRRELLLLESRQRVPAFVPPKLGGEESVAVGFDGRLPGEKAGVLCAELHLCTLNRFAAACVEHEALCLCIAAVCAHHEREVAHPHAGKLHDVVLLAEVRLRAGDERVVAGLHVQRRGDVLAALAVVGRRGQLHLPRALGLQAEQALRVVIVPIAAHLGGPVEFHEAEMQRGEIAVARGDDRPRCVPDAIRLDGERLRLDLLREVIAELPADARRERARTLLRNRVSLRRVGLHHLRCPLRPSPRG